jgi:hypothetical protein
LDLLPVLVSFEKCSFTDFHVGKIGSGPGSENIIPDPILNTDSLSEKFVDPVKLIILFYYQEHDCYCFPCKQPVPGLLFLLFAQQGRYFEENRRWNVQ